MRGSGGNAGSNAGGHGAHVSPRRDERRTPRQRRAQDTASAVLEAAEHLLVEVGYASSSTNAIAKRAGVSIGSLYQYFSGKEDVFRAVVRQHREEVLPLVVAAIRRMADPRIDSVEAILDLLRDMARVNARNPRLMAAIEGELGWLEHDGDADLDLSAQVAEILRARTRLPPKERAVTARLLIVVLTPLSRWLVHGRPSELDTELFVAGAGKMLRGLIGPDVRR